LFTGFVPFILLVAHSTVDKQAWEGMASSTVLAFSVFSFFINLSREIVKDIEDLEGDKRQGYNSFAISFGLEKARVLAIINTLFLIGLILFWMVYGNHFNNFRISVFSLLFLVAPLILSIFKLKTADEKYDFTILSKYLK